MLCLLPLFETPPLPSPPCLHHPAPPLPPPRRYAAVPYIPRDKCDAEMRRLGVGGVADNTICAGFRSDRRDSCAGDSVSARRQRWRPWQRTPARWQSSARVLTAAVPPPPVPCRVPQGGPLIWKRPGRPDLLVGVVSWGPTAECGKANLNLGAYSSMAKLGPWVDKHTAKIKGV